MRNANQIIVVSRNLVLTNEQANLTIFVYYLYQPLWKFFSINKQKIVFK